MVAGRKAARVLLVSGRRRPVRAADHGPVREERARAALGAGAERRGCIRSVGSRTGRHSLPLRSTRAARPRSSVSRWKDGAISPVRKLGSNGSSRVCLSPDGRYVAFDGPTDSDSLNMDVFVMPSSGGRAVPVVTGPYDDRLLDVDAGRAPHSRREQSLRVPTTPGSMQVGRRQRRRLAAAAPEGARDGGSDRVLSRRCFLLRAGRGESATSWSPTGARSRRRRLLHPTLATEHFSGSTRLPAWSPDGRKLAYLVDRGRSRPAETRVRVRDMETGAERTLADVNGAVYGLSWSPDGTSVAMTVTRTAVTERVPDPGRGRPARLVREFASPRSGEGISDFVWGPEGGVAYYVA